MPFVSTKNKAAAAGGTGGYLNPNKVPAGTSVRFALLQEEGFEFFECWGINAVGKKHPFRFASDPSPEEIEEEMGEDFSRQMDDKGIAFQPAKFAIAVPIYNYGTGAVEVLEMTQKTLINELDAISQMDDYEDLLEFDFVLGREGALKETTYSLRAVNRKKGMQADIDEAWSEARAGGFDITRMLTGDSPFKKG